MDELKPILLIVLACAAWGFSFPAADYALHYFDPFVILSLRFILASLVIGAALAGTGRLRPTRAELNAGAMTGTVLFITFATQLVGQQTVSPTVSALITGLYVVLVPLFAALIQVRLPSARILLCALLALAGLFLLSGAQLQMGVGEWLTVICAIAAAVHILLLAGMGKMDAGRLTLVQLATCAFWSLTALPVLGHLPAEWPLPALAAVAFLGLFASAVAYWAQTAALGQLAAERAALFMLLEPVFAALFGWLFFGVVLAPLQWAGGALILAGMGGASPSEAKVEAKGPPHPHS